MSNICIIPARSGSKGLKNKNIKQICGKPLLAYTIETAIQSNVFDCVMVSTDSELYAKIAKDYGADVPFLRSSELSSDKASSWDVVIDVLNKYASLGLTFDTIFLLQPTSPLRETKDLIESYSLYKAKKAKYVISVCETDHSPLWSNTLPQDFSLNNFISEKTINLPRQSLPKYYRINGAIYIVDRDFLFKNKRIVFDNSGYAYVMEKDTSIDIDDSLDFEIARLLLKKKKRLKHN